MTKQHINHKSLGITRPFDLEQRTFEFARAIRIFTRSLSPTLANLHDIKQLIRSSGSVGANYIEANDALGNKDFKMRLRISRKECKESLYWLQLIRETNPFDDPDEIDLLINEALELKRILSKILITKRPAKSYE